ncbi:MAG: aminotransferase class IV [Pseudomonadota bacterium]
MRDQSSDMVWCNGEIIPVDRALSAADRGFLLADGAFETMRVGKEGPVQWRLHRERLAHGLQVLGIHYRQLPEIPSFIGALGERLGLKTSANVARVTISRGVGERGVLPKGLSDPTCVISLAGCPALSSNVKNVIVWRGGKIYPSRYRGFKCLSSYTEHVAASRAAKNKAADDAMLLNHNGSLVCTTSANLIVVNADGDATTPRLADGALPGVCRTLFLEESLLTEKSISVDDLGGCVLLSVNVVRGPERLNVIEEGATSSDWDAATAQQLEAYKRLRNCYTTNFGLV